MTFHSSYSHFSKNHLLVGCLTALIGVPLMCCCLGGLFYGVFPLLEQADSSSLPLILIAGGLAVTLMLTALGLGLYFFWFRKNQSGS
jgi:hypothetical protein